MLNKNEFPARDLDQLQQLLGRIKQQKSSIKLGSRSFRTLTGMIDNPRHTALSSISEIARDMNVNASTLTRLSKRLGYRGFSEFQNVFREHISQEPHFYSDKLSRLLADQDADEYKNLSLMADVAHDETSNISVMLKNIQPQTLDMITEKIAKSRSVRIHGLRQFFSLACFLSYGLGMIRDNVDVLGDSGHGVVHSLAQLHPNDVLIVLGAEPYTRATADACRIAYEHGLSVIALTDSYASPLAAHSHHVVIMPIEGHYFGNNVASWFIFAEGLLAVVAQSLGEKSIKAIKHREKLIKEFGIAQKAKI